MQHSSEQSRAHVRPWPAASHFQPRYGTDATVGWREAGPVLVLPPDAAPVASPVAAPVVPRLASTVSAAPAAAAPSGPYAALRRVLHWMTARVPVDSAASPRAENAVELAVSRYGWGM